jgi:hypothetical protein
MIQRTTTPSITKRLSNSQNEPQVPQRKLLLQPISFDNNTLDKKHKNRHRCHWVENKYYQGYLEL